jgi:hypothetical protein
MGENSIPIPLASPAYYAWLYPKMAEVAKRLGYALTLHGSLSRDFDVVAIPWVEEAVDADVLADTLKDELGGFYAPNDFPGAKPHGRRAYSIHLGGGPYIDLSVMPKA